MYGEGECVDGGNGIEADVDGGDDGAEYVECSYGTCECDSYRGYGDDDEYVDGYTVVAGDSGTYDDVGATTVAVIRAAADVNDDGDNVGNAVPVVKYDEDADDDDEADDADGDGGDNNAMYEHNDEVECEYENVEDGGATGYECDGGYTGGDDAEDADGDDTGYEGDDDGYDDGCDDEGADDSDDDADAYVDICDDDVDAADGGAVGDDINDDEAVVDGDADDDNGECVCT